jgi:hypothetical protein
MVLPLATVLLAAAAASPAVPTATGSAAPSLQEAALAPLPPLELEMLPAEPAPAARANPLPATPPPALPPPATAAAAPATPPAAAPVEIAPAPAAAAETDQLLHGLPWIEGGFGSLMLAPTQLNGTTTLLSGASLHVVHGDWFAGAVLWGGGPSSVGVTWGGLRGGASVYRWRWLDVAAAMTVGAGSASALVAGRADSAAVLVWQPEVAARLRLLPWARATFGLGYRMMNAGTWGGPPGDRLGGVTALAGLELGSP